MKFFEYRIRWWHDKKKEITVEHISQKFMIGSVELGDVA